MVPLWCSVRSRARPGPSAEEHDPRCRTAQPNEWYGRADSIRRERFTLRTLAITQNITLDGSIEMLGDWFDPQGQAGVDNADLLAETHRQDSTADGLLLGRRTFEDFRGYWPSQSDDATGVTDYLNQVHKYVVSTTMTDPDWRHSTVLSGDLVDDVVELKRSAGQDIVVTGSIMLCHALIRANLVDEYRLFVYPTVQGRGRRLFPDGFEIPELTLLDAKAFAGGITYSRYAPAAG